MKRVSKTCLARIKLPSRRRTTLYSKRRRRGKLNSKNRQSSIQLKRISRSRSSKTLKICSVGRLPRKLGMTWICKSCSRSSILKQRLLRPRNTSIVQNLHWIHSLVYLKEEESRLKRSNKKRRNKLNKQKRKKDQLNKNQPIKQRQRILKNRLRKANSNNNRLNKKRLSPRHHGIKPSECLSQKRLQTWISQLKIKPLVFIKLPPSLTAI